MQCLQSFKFRGWISIFKIPRYRLYFVWGYYVIWTWPLLPYIYREVPVMIGSYIPHGASVSTHLISPVQSLENTSPLLSYRAQENVTLSTLSGEKEIVPPHRQFIASKQARNKIHPYLLKYYLLQVNQLSCFIRNKNSLFYLKLELVCDCYSTGSDVITHLWAVSRSVHLITIVARAKTYTSSSLRCY